MELELRGHDTVTVKLSFVDSVVKVTLMAAESNGIWIDVDELRATLPGLESAAVGGEDTTERSRGLQCIFIPFTQIQYVVKGSPVPS